MLTSSGQCSIQNLCVFSLNVHPTRTRCVSNPRHIWPDLTPYCGHSKRFRARTCGSHTATAAASLLANTLSKFDSKLVQRGACLIEALQSFLAYRSTITLLYSSELAQNLGQIRSVALRHSHCIHGTRPPPSEYHVRNVLLRIAVSIEDPLRNQQCFHRRRRPWVK